MQSNGIGMRESLLSNQFDIIANIFHKVEKKNDKESVVERNKTHLSAPATALFSVTILVKLCAGVFECMYLFFFLSVKFSYF